ncbi:hypothetical protein SCA6_018457 [Theobroma cacao]
MLKHYGDFVRVSSSKKLAFQVILHQRNFCHGTSSFLMFSSHLTVNSLGLKFMSTFNRKLELFLPIFLPNGRLYKFRLQTDIVPRLV